LRNARTGGARADATDRKMHDRKIKRRKGATEVLGSIFLSNIFLSSIRKGRPHESPQWKNILHSLREQ
jgi:hypothetical protein